MEKEPSGESGPTSQASTEDVLGASVGDSNVPERWAKQYEALVRARRDMTNRRGDLMSQANEHREPIQRNPAELGTDSYDRDFALGMATSEQEVLYEIDEALNRIKNGTYGICEATGKPIEPDRLMAIPWTRFSAEAERRLESEGQVSRAGLGEEPEIPRETPPVPSSGEA